MAISVPSKNTFLIWSTSKTTFCQNVPHPHLHHLGMDVEAGVAQLSDLLGQELHPLSGVTEDNGLVDLKLWRKEEKTQRMCYRPIHHTHPFGLIVIKILSWPIRC